MTSLNDLTLKQTLSCLTEAHRFSEVLDRLSELADSNADTSESKQLAHEWHLVAGGLEILTLHVKRLESHPDLH